MNENTEIMLLYPKLRMVCEQIRISLLNILYTRSILSSIIFMVGQWKR